MIAKIIDKIYKLAETFVKFIILFFAYIIKFLIDLFRGLFTFFGKLIGAVIYKLILYGIVISIGIYFLLKFI